MDGITVLNEYYKSAMSLFYFVCMFILIFVILTIINIDMGGFGVFLGFISSLLVCLFVFVCIQPEQYKVLEVVITEESKKQSIF